MQQYTAKIAGLTQKFNPVEYFKEFNFEEYLKFDLKNIKGDLLGGLTSAIVALPLALGFGILATNGDPRGAVAGLYGAIFTGILASLFGGTSQQITGPTGGMTVVLTEVFVEVSRSGNYQTALSALLLACLIAGIIQIAFGLFKLGRFVSFVPQPVIVGFTNGIAILIFLQQLKTFAAAPLVAAITIGFIVLTPMFNKSLPKLFIGLVLGSLVAYFFASHYALFNIGFNWQGFSFYDAGGLKLVGEIPRSLQLPSWPTASLAAWRKAIPAGFTIAILGCLETLLASVVVDTVTNTEHNSNRELVGQGIGNSLAALFGGIAGTGAIVRTTINIRSGGVSKLSGVICGLFLLMVVLFLAPVAGFIPLAALAGVLMMAAIGMFEWEPLKMIPKTPAADSLVMVTTMLVTVFADLISAVLIGMVLATMLFLNRMSKLGVIPRTESELKGLSPETKEIMKKQKIAVFNIEGPLFFGAVKTFSRELTQASPDTLILDMKNVPVLDLSGAQAIENVVSRMKAKKKRVILSGLRPEVRQVLHQLEIIQKIGADSFPDDLYKAVDYAVSLSQNIQPSLADYFKDDLVIIDAEAGSKEELFEDAAQKALQAGYVYDKEAFLQNLWHRENDSPTSLGHGVAIPHSRSGAASDEIVVIFIKLKKAIAGYDGIDGQPVKLILMISAGDNVNGYLKVLKLITLAVGREEPRQRLLESKSVEEVLDVFKGIKE
ncbi:PTS sugar transporter subunit IIA [candidate division TA06 bacterium]|nr:PTS sugar transporter subunit IIA [candidate division TA06 bacterium]